MKINYHFDKQKRLSSEIPGITTVETIRKISYSSAFAQKTIPIVTINYFRFKPQAKIIRHSFRGCFLHNCLPASLSFPSSQVKITTTTNSSLTFVALVKKFHYAVLFVKDQRFMVRINI